MDRLDPIDAVRSGLWITDLPKPEGVDMTSDLRRTNWDYCDKQAKRIHDLLYNIELTDKERIAKIRESLAKSLERGYFYARKK